MVVTGDAAGRAPAGRPRLVELDEEACWAFLHDQHLGRVAVVEFGLPVVYPVNYALDGRSVVFRTGRGSKMKAAIAGREVAFEVDQADPLFETGTSVIVHGRMWEVAHPDRELGPDALALRPWAPAARDHFVRVVAEAVTGRHIRPGTIPDGVAVDGG